MQKILFYNSNQNINIISCIFIKWNYRTLINFRTEPNSVELIRFCHGEPYPNFYEFFDYSIIVFFCIKFGSVRSNRIDQFNIIQYLHGLNASYSVNFEVRFDWTEPNFLKKKHKNNKKVRVRFAVTNSYLIRFGKSFTFDGFTVSDKTFFGSELIWIPRPKTERSCDELSARLNSKFP